MKILIIFNKITKNWNIFINKYLFITVSFNYRKIKEKLYSKNYMKYLYITKILRQFGLLKPINNKK